MYRQNISVYCKTPEIAAKVRAFAKELNAQTSSVAPSLPAWLEEIMNGGVFPSPEDCTAEERDLLYSPEICPLVIKYRQTKNPDFKNQICKLINRG